jgi:hypothetical protein
MNNRPLLYVAGPYRKPDPVANTHAVCRVAMQIYERTRWCPVVPHLSLLWHAVTPRVDDFWLDYDLHLMRKCDAVVRLPGDSPGADAEIVEAERLGMMILDISEIPTEAVAEWTNRPIAQS